MSQPPLMPTDFQVPKGAGQYDPDQTDAAYAEGRSGADSKPNEPSGGAAAGESHPVPSDDAAEGAAAQGESTSAPPPPGEDYPPQLHAGKVGYGPEYGKAPGLGDKVGGLTEQVKGKVTGKPDLVEHGHDRMTGELQHKEQEGEDEKSSPFKNS